MTTPEPPDSPTVPGPLTWSLGIATMNRPKVLARCLACAATQTRPPIDVAVCDASKDPAPVLALMDEMRQRYPDIGWLCRHSRPGVCAQRNHAWRDSRGDVVFLIDDDSLMYPDCAERIMAVYETDTQQRIVSVMAMLDPVAPDEAGADTRPVRSAAVATDAPSKPAASPRRKGGIARSIKDWLDVDCPLPPYDGAFHSHSVPDEIKALGLGLPRLMHGCRMTARRSVLEREPFADRITRPGSDELDASYRWSRHGLQTTCFEARLHHVETNESREKLRQRSVASALNRLAAASYFPDDRGRARAITAAFFRKMLVAGLMHDLKKGDLKLPRTQGNVIGWLSIGRAFGLPREKVWAWHRLAMGRHLG